MMITKKKVFTRENLHDRLNRQKKNINNYNRKRHTPNEELPFDKLKRKKEKRKRKDHYK